MDDYKDITVHFVIFEEELEKIKEKAIEDKKNGQLTNIIIGHHEDTYCSWYPYAIVQLRTMKISLNSYVNRNHYHVLCTFPYKARKRYRGGKHFWKNLPDTNDAECPQIIRKFRRFARKRLKKGKSRSKKHISVIDDKELEKIYDALYKCCRDTCSIP